MCEIASVSSFYSTRVLLVTVKEAEGEVTNGNCLSRSTLSETFPRAFTLPELIAYVDATAA